MREIARFAGCHIYNEAGDVLYANRKYVAISATYSGIHNIKLPGKFSAYEVYEEKYYSHNSNSIDVEMLKGETKMFRIDLDLKG